jgi:RNA polymerase-binding transcription factor DksA
MNIEHAKLKLEEEMETVMQELADLGHEDIDESATEPDEIADRMEAEEEHSSEKATLLARKNEIVAAIGRMDTGTYGFCEECGEKIEEDRLEANPAAATCKLHME